MEKLYRLVGAAGMCVRAYGVSFGVRVNDPRVLEMVNVHLPPGSSRQLAPIVKRLYSFYVSRSEWRPGVRRFHAVYSDDQMLHRSENESDLYQEFERDVNSFVAEMSTN